jgi:integrase
MPLKLYQRGKVWHFRGTVGNPGRRLRGSCKTTDKAIASRQIAEIESREWKCSFDGPQAVLTFAQAAMLYRKAGKSTRYLAPVEDYLKDMLVKDINAGTIKQMGIELFPNCSGASRNRLAIVPAQAIINHAAELQLCPPIRVKRFEEETKEKVPVTLDWLKAFAAEASPNLGAFALFMYFTGARPSEAIGVQWDDVDMVGRTALIRETKGGTERTAHLPGPLFVALANLPHVRGRGVFVYRNYGDFQHAWDDAIERAGIKRLTPHCCRHGFATGLLRRGLDVLTVAHLGGWKDAGQVLRTYGHANKDRKLTDLLVEGNADASKIQILEDECAFRADGKR